MKVSAIPAARAPEPVRLNTLPVWASAVAETQEQRCEEGAIRAHAGSIVELYSGRGRAGPASEAS